MSKRFTDQGKWDDPWFFDLSAENKLVWLYLCDKCDIAGIWKVSIPHIKFSVGSNVDIESFLEVADGRIIPIDDGKKWYIPSFVKFQNGNLVANNNCHKAILKILSDHGLLENGQGLVSPSSGALEPPCNGNGNGKEENVQNTGIPIHTTENEYSASISKHVVCNDTAMPLFREFISCYPTWEQHEVVALNAWKFEIANNPGFDPQAAVDSARQYRVECAMKNTPPRYVKTPHRFLSDGMWANSLRRPVEEVDLFLESETEPW